MFDKYLREIDNWRFRLEKGLEKRIFHQEFYCSRKRHLSCFLFSCFFERKREQQKWRGKLVPFSYLSGVKKKKEKKGERKGMREKVTSSRVSRIVQILENKILSLLYATTIIFMQLEI